MCRFGKARPLWRTRVHRAPLLFQPSRSVVRGSTNSSHIGSIFGASGGFLTVSTYHMAQIRRPSLPIELQNVPSRACLSVPSPPKTLYLSPTRIDMHNIHPSPPNYIPAGHKTDATLVRRAFRCEAADSLLNLKFSRIPDLLWRHSFHFKRAFISRALRELLVTHISFSTPDFLANLQFDVCGVASIQLK